MTGYSSHKSENKDLKIEFNIKSVNGRFLEARFHLPKEFIFLEPELRKALNTKFQRGTVDIFCHRKSKRSTNKSKIEMDVDLAQKIVFEISKLGKSLKLKPEGSLSEISLMELLKVAPILKIQEESEVTKPEVQLVLKTFKDSLDKCYQERVREGHSIRKELLSLLNQLAIQVASIKRQRGVNSQEAVQKFKDKIKAKGNEALLADQKVQQEIFFLTEKADIAEEIQRLEEHLKNYKNLLLSKKSEGKKIDFYTQELLREINTVGSKSQSAQITNYVVESKGLIEKLREQAQNIE
ncbi:MAG: YicC family protein [Bdellovibrionaceae bacterium]|nr:YicC family protein [Pseudobdellovibrionaceae bacterium]